MSLNSFPSRVGRRATKNINIVKSVEYNSHNSIINNDCNNDVINVIINDNNSINDNYNDSKIAPDGSAEPGLDQYFDARCHDNFQARLASVLCTSYFEKNLLFYYTHSGKEGRVCAYQFVSHGFKSRWMLGPE